MSASIATRLGERNTASNIGLEGVGFYQQKVGVDIQFRNLAANSAKVSVALDAINNTVNIDVVEANLALNNIGGTLNINKGGTGSITASDARDNLGITALLEKNFRKNFLLMGG